MKAKLLASALLLTSASFAQLTNANSPAIGTSTNLVLLDSNVTAYPNLNTTGVTWDYTTVTGTQTPLATKTASIINPTTHTSSASYPNATKAFEIAGLVTNFYNSTANSKNSYGYVFNEPSMGEIKVIYGTNDQVQMTYPFDVNSSVADVFSGTILLTYMGMPQTMQCTGNSVAKIDGKGTLKVGDATMTDVLRYKINDTVVGTLNIFGQNISMNITRTQYEYFKSSFGLPTFIHYTMKLEVPAMGVNQEFSVVLSENGPSTVGVETLDTDKLNVYPNPANDVLNITGDYTQYEIIDQLGRVVAQGAQTAQIDVQNLKQGVYTITLSGSEKARSVNFVKQ